MTEVHFYKPDLQAITFASSYGAAMTIHQDGRITLGENAKPTEAAAACIDAMSHMIQDMIRNAVEAENERLLAAVVTWLKGEAAKANAAPDWDRETRAEGEALDAAADAIERGDHHKGETQ